MQLEWCGAEYRICSEGGHGGAEILKFASESDFRYSQRMLRHLADRVREERSAVALQAGRGHAVDSMPQHEREVAFTEASLALMDVIASCHIAGDDLSLTVVRLVMEQFVPNLRWSSPSTKLLITAVEEYSKYVEIFQGEEFCIPKDEIVSPVTQLLVCASFLRICEHASLVSDVTHADHSQHNAIAFKIIEMVKKATRQLMPPDAKEPCFNFPECLATWVQGAALLAHGRRLAITSPDMNQDMVKRMVLESVRPLLALCGVRNAKLVVLVYMTLQSQPFIQLWLFDCTELLTWYSFVLP